MGGYRLGAPLSEQLLYRKPIALSNFCSILDQRKRIVSELWLSERLHQIVTAEIGGCRLGAQLGKQLFYGKPIALSNFCSIIDQRKGVVSELWLPERINQIATAQIGGYR